MGKVIELKVKINGTLERIRFYKSQYFNKNPYIGVLMWDKDMGSWKEWGAFSVNLAGRLLHSNQIFANINNRFVENLLPTLINSGLLVDTGKTRTSGYCIYPLVEITDKFMEGFVEQW